VFAAQQRHDQADLRLLAVALLGANGSGKTTLLRTMMGLQPAWEGRILLEGRFVHKLPPYRRAALGMAMVPPGKTYLHLLPLERSNVSFK
jgi:ABC-type branched-subunit amino acid transport system ATPase component